MNSNYTFYASEMSKLELLARNLLDINMMTLESLWEFQLSLVNQQISLQEEADACYSRKRSLNAESTWRVKAVHSDSWKNQVIQLQRELKHIEDRIRVCKYVRDLSRQLGDALAWFLFQFDESKIRPLTENSPVPPVIEGIGLRGVISIAEDWFRTGRGFPILHDITSSLRIGDITLITKEDNFTFEIKTRLVEKDDEATTVWIDIFSVHRKLAQASAHGTHVSQTDVDEPASEFMTVELNKVLERQIDRMEQAYRLQRAEAGSSVNLNGRDLIIVKVTSESKASHWDTVEQLIEQAKVSNIAGEQVDGAFVYVVNYNSHNSSVLPWELEPVTTLQLELLPAILASKFPSCDITDRNTLWFGINSEYLEERQYPHHLPFFWYSLPVDILMDILWRRVVISVFVNLGKLVEAINQTTLVARYPTAEEVHRVLIPVMGKEDWPDGLEGEVHLESIHEYASKIVNEYLSLDGFVNGLVELAVAMKAIIRQKADKQICQFQDDQPMN